MAAVGAADGQQDDEECFQREHALLMLLRDLFTHADVFVCLLSSVWMALQVNKYQIHLCMSECVFSRDWLCCFNDQ